MSFWDNNKGTFKAAGIATLKGAAVGGKKVAKVSYHAGKTAYANRDQSRAAHGSRNPRSNGAESVSPVSYSEARPLSSLSNPNAFGPPPTRNVAPHPVGETPRYETQVQPVQQPAVTATQQVAQPVQQQMAPARPIPATPQQQVVAQQPVPVQPAATQPVTAQSTAQSFGSQPAITYDQLQRFGSAAFKHMVDQSQQPTAAPVQQSPAVSYENPYHQTPQAPEASSTGAPPVYSRAPAPLPVAEPTPQPALPVTPAKQEQPALTINTAFSPSNVHSPSNGVTSQYGHFGVPPPKDEEEQKAKTPLADPKVFAPPPIHRARGQSQTPPTVSSAIVSAQPTASQFPPVPLPPRNNGTSDSHTAPVEETAASEKKNWMDTSNVGPPPPRRAMNGVEKSRSTSSSIQPPPKRAPIAAPSLPTRVSPEPNSVSSPPQPAKTNWMDVSLAGPPPPKIYRGPTQDAQSKPTIKARPSSSAPQAPEKKKDVSQFAPPPRPHKAADKLAPGSMTNTETVVSEEVFSNLKRNVRSIKTQDPIESESITPKKAPPPKPAKKISFSKETSTESEEPVKSSSPAPIADGDSIAAMRANLKKTNLSNDVEAPVEQKTPPAPKKKPAVPVKKVSTSESHATKEEESMDRPALSKRNTSTKHIPIIRPKPISANSRSSIASTESTSTSENTTKRVGGIALPGLSDAARSYSPLKPASPAQSISEKKKPAPPPIKPKPKAESNVQTSSSSRQPSFISNDRNASTPPPLGPRPKLATPPPAPPSRRSMRTEVPDINLNIASGWWAKDGPLALPDDLQGLNYSTSFGYSMSENFRIFAFRLSDLSTLKLRFTWSKSTTDPVKSHNFEQKIIAPPTVASQRQIVSSYEKFGDYVASWCESKEGTTVGSGECWDLAHDALEKGCGKHAFVSNGLVHGYLLLTIVGRGQGSRPEVIPSAITDDIRRGDILQFKSSVFKDGNVTMSYGAPDHTSIVLSNIDKTHLRIIHQNVGGVKKVQRAELDLIKATTGEIKIYRPMSADWITELTASWP